MGYRKKSHLNLLQKTPAMVIRNYAPRSPNVLISPKTVSQSTIHVDTRSFCNAHVETAEDSWLDSIQLPASSTRWLAVSKPVTLMSETREHSWNFRFKEGEREPAMLFGRKLPLD